MFATRRSECCDSGFHPQSRLFRASVSQETKWPQPPSTLGPLNYNFRRLFVEEMSIQIDRAFLCHFTLGDLQFVLEHLPGVICKTYAAVFTSGGLHYRLQVCSIVEWASGYRIGSPVLTKCQ